MTKQWDSKAYCGCCLKRRDMSDRRFITLANMAAVCVKYREEHGENAVFNFSQHVNETSQLCNKCRRSLTTIKRKKKIEIATAQEEYNNCTTSIIF
jgi:hypothetical protein